MKKRKTSGHDDRIKVLERISEYEKLGGDYFFADIESDPPGRELLPHEADYLKKKLPNKIKTFIANFIVYVARKKMTKKLQIEVKGSENLNGVEGGAFVTSNHFSIYDSFAVRNALDLADKKRRLHIIAKEGNYFVPGFNGFILKHANILHLSSNIKTMKNLDNALSELLNKGEFILIYPEQAMWWNYKKPRPYKTGAFYFASKHNVPVIPCFVTLSDLDTYDKHGFLNQKYTIHVMEPIYPDKTKDKKTNQIEIMEKNHQCCKQKYEEIYGKSLEY